MSHNPTPHPVTSSRQDAILRELVRAKVGEMDLVTLSDAIKEIMLSEAIERSSGNLSRASTLLGISRQGVQQMLQRFGLKTWAEELRRRSTAPAERSSVPHPAPTRSARHVA